MNSIVNNRGSNGITHIYIYIYTRTYIYIYINKKSYFVPMIQFKNKLVVHNKNYVYLTWKFIFLKTIKIIYIFVHYMS